MLHLHDFDHEEVWLGRRVVDRQDSINDGGREPFRKGRVQLCTERCASHGHEQFSIDISLKLELIQKLERSN